jgi:hypothetical protein
LGECGCASEAGKVERDDVVVAECLTDGLPADSGFSDSVQQDQWLARSGSMMGERVGVGADRRDAMLSPRRGGTASEHRHPPNSHRQPHYFPQMGLWMAGHLSVETIRDQLERAIASCRDLSKTLPGEEARSISDRSTQFASLERLPGKAVL